MLYIGMCVSLAGGFTDFEEKFWHSSSFTLSPLSLSDLFVYQQAVELFIGRESTPARENSLDPVPPRPRRISMIELVHFVELIDKFLSCEKSQ